MVKAPQDPHPEDLGALVRKRRERARLTQEELAEQAGISVRAISDIERGVAKSPQRRTIAALAGPLQLSEVELGGLLATAKAARPRAELAAPATATASVFSPAVVGVLPPEVADLTGRAAELAGVRELAEVAAAGGRAGEVLVLSGPPGTGKTAMATNAAHALGRLFPDGRIFLKLRGMAEVPGTPADLLHVVLRSLGVDGVQVPAEVEQRTNLCRFLLRDRRVLIVLDDAADEAQVRPLLLGGSRCLTLVTSRQMLVGLAGVRRTALDVLSPDAAVRLVTSIVGPPRVVAEPQASAELVELCGRLPLALRIAGNRLASRPRWPIDRLVDQLRDRGGRLTALTAGDLRLRGVFDMSYRQLRERAAQAFRRLSLVPGADFAAGAVVALTGSDEADDLLEELTDASLLQPSPEQGRYQFHDLLRVFAAECLVRDEVPEAAREAEDRLTAWLVRTATGAAGGHFRPSGAPEVACPDLPDHVAAGRWLEVERTNWLPALRRTAARGGHREVIALARVMHWYSEIGGTAATWHEVFGLGLASALALDDRLAEAALRNFLSWTEFTLFDRPAEAAELARSARAAAEAAGDPREQAWARVYLINSDPEADHTTLLDEAIALFARAGNPLDLHIARMHRGTRLHQSGDHRAAAVELAACIDYFSRPTSENTPVDATVHGYLMWRSAENLAALGSPDLALRHCAQALALFQAATATMGEATVLRTWGSIAHSQGDLPEAQTRLQQALTLFTHLGQPHRQLETLDEIATITQQTGDARAAHRHREHATALRAALAETNVAGYAGCEGGGSGVDRVQ
ncbi:transcriptional regulator with XRE-family HTH domain/tetratricopeptide (TPR) repeat protein [Actinokineospora baliensis]|uniref:ATP-binding protein n=1 Tax=Actinokineospora baliensis TaxID=547056 RepID=UPI00195BB9F0|nr:NB-ARC domain-containing protein [Actinokineospora baliensis]MBM7773271.1 transcriptional regulator with XRE-family HTH domain/tetratricopeptide (TPR) repeat protein [Actinokineospora baliensis]